MAAGMLAKSNVPAEQICYGFTPDWDSQTYVQSMPDAKFQVAQTGTLELNSGEMLAIAGDKSLRVETDVAAVMLEPGAVALIKAAKNGEADSSVIVVNEPRHGGVAVRVPGGQFYALHASEKLTISNRGPIAGKHNAPTGHIEKDGIPVGGDYYVLQAKVNLNRLMSENPLVSCVYKQIPGEHKKAPEYERKSEMLAFNTTAGSDELLKPVAYQTVNAYSPLSGSATQVSLDGNSQLVLPKSGCRACNTEKHLHLALVTAPEYQLPTVSSVAEAAVKPAVSRVAADQFEMSEGESLFAPSRKLSVKTDHGIVNINKGAIVMIITNGKGTRVLDLHDVGLNDVKVAFDNRVVTLHPGQELDLVQGDVAEGKRLMADPDNIAHRRTKVSNYGDNMVAVTSDFSLVNALTMHPLLVQLNRSADPADKKLLDTLCKTTAALFVSQGASHGPYYAPSGAGIAANEMNALQKR